MRLRYLAAAGPGPALEKLSADIAAQGSLPLERVLHAPGLRAWVVPRTPWIASADGSAVAVGLLFDPTDGHRRQDRLPPAMPAAQFAARYWGPYVHIAGDAAGHSVLRDPSAGVAAYHRRAGPLDVYASDASLLALAGGQPLEPDLVFLREWLTFPYLRGNRTGATGVREVVPGEAWHTAHGRTDRTLAWSPWPHARPERALDRFEDAAALVRETVLEVVPRLARHAGDTVLQLSGGLDSSILAASLNGAGYPFRAVTFATRAPDGDERAYAREVARDCGIELAELVEDHVPPAFGQIGPIALRPAPNALLQPLHRALRAHFALTGADLVLDGAGGDNVFCSLNTAAPAHDALRRYGLGAGVTTMQDVARLHGATFWHVARATGRRIGRKLAAWQRDESFLAPGAAADAAHHPWLDPPAGVAQGTFEHVQAIVGIHHFLADPAPGVPATLHPLLAQPIIEVCLRIPAPLWVRGGRDRAVARAAFRELLPAAILARRAKGRLESMFVTGFMAGRRQLEALLLDGRLAEAGLLDQAAVAGYLRRDEDPGDAGYIRLLELSSAETWLRAFEA